MTDQLKGALNGDIWSTTRGVYEYIDDANQRKDNNKKVGWLRGHIEGKESTYSGITEENLKDQGQRYGNLQYPDSSIGKKLGSIGETYDTGTENWTVGKDIDEIGKIYNDEPTQIFSNGKIPGTLFSNPKTIPVSVKKIGSLATSNTIANNI